MSEPELPPLPPRALSFARECGRRAKITVLGPRLAAAPAVFRNAVLLVDGGVRWRSALPAGLEGPVLSVGDGDSSLGSALDVTLPPAKDYSDLGFALAVLSRVDVARLDLYGFLGGRRDHEWVNLGELARFAGLQRKGQGQLRVNLYEDAASTAPAVTVLGRGAHSLKHDGTFTLVHFVAAETTLRGDVEYPLGRGSLVPAHSSVGLSNRASGHFQLHSEEVSVLFWCVADAPSIEVDTARPER